MSLMVWFCKTLVAILGVHIAKVLVLSHPPRHPQPQSDNHGPTLTQGLSVSRCEAELL